MIHLFISTGLLTFSNLFIFQLFAFEELSKQGWFYWWSTDNSQPVKQSSRNPARRNRFPAGTGRTIFTIQLPHNLASKYMKFSIQKIELKKKIIIYDSFFYYISAPFFLDYYMPAHRRK